VTSTESFGGEPITRTVVMQYPNHGLGPIDKNKQGPTAGIIVQLVFAM